MILYNEKVKLNEMFLTRYASIRKLEREIKKRKYSNFKPRSSVLLGSSILFLFKFVFQL